MLTQRIAVCLTVLILFAAHAMDAAGAAEHVISQKGRQFSEAELTVHVGDTVFFANDDDVPHNVVSTSGRNAFDLGHQPPGVATPVTFTEPGEMKIECLMHPRMHLTILVKR